MAIQLEEWADASARREMNAAKDAGIVPERQWHYGRAVLLYIEAGRFKEAADLLDRGLRRTGGYGSQFVAGLRSGVVLLDGARSYVGLGQAENVDAWIEGDKLPPGDRSEAAHDEPHA